MKTAEDFWRDISAVFRPPVVLGDIGTFFNQDITLATQLLEQAAAGGTRYIKGEILHDPEICLPTDATEHYLDQTAKQQQENYRALIERKVVSLTDYRKLFARCAHFHLGLVLSVYDTVGADFASEIGACALKIASTNVVHAPLIRHCAGLQLPLIIDSGKSSLSEVQQAIEWAREAGADRLLIEYSPPAPPAALEKHNLQILPDLQKMFGLPVGLSDHHHGEEMLYAATALGARLLEKGLCADNPNSDQDVYHALSVSRLPAVTRACHNIHAALGSAQAAYTPPAQRPTARMGLVAETDLQPGDQLGLNNVRFAFPTLGIPVEHWDQVAGSTVTQAIAANTPLEWNHVSA